MEIGAVTIPSATTMAPGPLAVALEERGFSSLQVPDHTHVPAAKGTVYRSNSPDGEAYRSIHDPFVWLTLAAAATTRLRIGTAILLVAQRDPIITAKQVASLDVLSDGRFTFGFGFGWNVPEMENHGVDPTHRRTITREKVNAIQGMWTGVEVGYDGEFVTISPSTLLPTPAQQPGPPVLLGAAAGPSNFRHLVDYCDGWLASWRLFDPGSVAMLHEAATAAGRDPATIQLRGHRVPPDPAVLDQLESLGFQEATLTLPSSGADVLLPLLDEYSALLSR